MVIHIGITRAYRETTTANWSERDMHPRPQDFKSGAITTEPQVDHFRYIKFSLAARLRGKKQRKMNDHVYSILLFVFSKPHYQAEFEYIENWPIQMPKSVCCHI